MDKYDNVMIMGDINIDTHDIQHPRYTKLSSFCDVFGLSNLVNDETCFTKNHSTSIDVMLTNKPRCFQNTTVFETGLSPGGVLCSFQYGGVRANIWGPKFYVKSIFGVCELQRGQKFNIWGPQNLKKIRSVELGAIH